MGTNLETKTFSTLKLKELQCNKIRLKQPLLGAISTPNFTQICWTTVEKWSKDISTHKCTCRCDDLYPTKSLHTHNSALEGAMKLKFAPICSSSDALSDGILFGRSQNFQILAKNHGL